MKRPSLDQLGPCLAALLILNATAGTPPVITRPPTGIIIPAGSGITLSADVTGDVTDYEWRRGGVAVSSSFHFTDTAIPNPSGGNTYVYTLPSVDLFKAGQYTLWVKNDSGQRISAPAAITVGPANPAWKFSLLHAFTGGADGATVQGKLLLGADGLLYGAAQAGGGHQLGTIFSVSPGGGFHTLYTFTGGDDGGNPTCALVQDPSGVLYGTTYGEGTGGAGTVFRMTTKGALKTLYAFTGGDDGGQPLTGLTFGPDGLLYGSTGSGGSGGKGTIFTITTNGDFTTLTSLSDRLASLNSSFIQNPDGRLLATTAGPDSRSLSGTLIAVNAGQLTDLFAGRDLGSLGFFPTGQLAPAPDGTLYGTTQGGTYGFDSVYSLSPDGTIRRFYYFAGMSSGSDGSSPWGGLILGRDGNLYGTTGLHGSGDDGTVFQMTTNGVLTTLYSFSQQQGFEPNAPLIMGPNGSLYGVTAWGGTASGGRFSGDGMIYSLTPPNAPPIITIQPAGQRGIPGATVTLSVGASGTGPFSYQWRLGGTNLAGATGSSLTLTNLTETQAGNYTVIVTGAYGSATSAVATIYFPPKPEIHLYPVVTITDIVGTKYRIEATDDLARTNSWTTLTNVTLPSSPYYFVDPSTPQAVKRLYRAVYVP